MVLVMIAVDGSLLEGSVHALDLAIGPGMIELGKSVFDDMLMTHTIKDVFEGRGIFFAVSKLDAVVSKDGVDVIRHSGNEIAQELCSLRLTVLFQ